MQGGFEMEQLLLDILNWIKTNNNRLIIGISGHGAAGKTTFAKKLMTILSINEVNYLNTDSYIISSDVRKNASIEYTYNNENHRFKMTACHPSAHHLLSLERDVRMIRDGHDLYTIGTHYSKSELLPSKNKVTIVEGMCVAFLNPSLFDLRIYFYTDGETEYYRRSSRDILERGTDIHYLRQSHEERRIQYEVFMHPYSEKFDIIIKTNGQHIHIEKNQFNFN